MCDESSQSQQIIRYAKHFITGEAGYAGQEKLLKSKVLIIGAGVFGLPLLFYIAASGASTLGIVDCGAIEPSSIESQKIYSNSDLGKKKIDVLEKKIKKINPEIKILKYELKVDEDNIEDIIKDYDFVIDTLDSFPTSLLMVSYSYFLKKSLK